MNEQVGNEAEVAIVEGLALSTGRSTARPSATKSVDHLVPALQPPPFSRNDAVLGTDAQAGLGQRAIVLSTR